MLILRQLRFPTMLTTRSFFKGVKSLSIHKPCDGLLIIWLGGEKRWQIDQLLNSNFTFRWLTTSKTFP